MLRQMISVPQRRVVVTGLGAITNVGADVPTMWRSLIEGRSGIDRISAFEQDDQWTVRIAGEIRDFDPKRVIDEREAKRMDRFCLLGLAAAVEAAADCGFDFSAGDPYRRGVVIGSGIGGILTIEVGHEKLLRTSPKKISPFTVPKLMVNACAGNVSIRFNLRGSNSATATACATGAHAIGTAFHLIQRGDADLIFAGGSEAAITPLCIGSFAAMKALSTRNDDPPRASRPFDADRDGFVLAEGAGVVVLEELEHAKSRGAETYAEVIGFGSSGDATHIAAPDPAGQGARASMKFAIRDAGVTLDAVDYINAHGTATPLGDAGGIESVIAVLAVKEDVVPPTINLDNPSDTSGMNFVAHEAQRRTVNCALNNSFGFGGHNVTLVFGKYRGD
jgi:3-oxoacyl-[acyl-carrier-protein] synthase II